MPAPTCAALRPPARPLPSYSAAAGRVLSPRYRLLPADLRDLAGLGAALETAGLDWGAPTFVLSECVLVYMEGAASAALVAWLGARLATAAMAVYEQVGGWEGG